MFECLRRFELQILLLEFLWVFELRFVFLKLLIVKFMVDSWFLVAELVCFMLMFKFVVDLWILFTESLCLMFMLRIT